MSVIDRPDAYTPTEITVYGEMRRGRGAQLVVGLRDYRGNEKIDVRVFERRQNGDDVKIMPTGRGVTLRATEIDEVIRLLQEAKEDAEMRGLV